MPRGIVFRPVASAGCRSLMIGSTTVRLASTPPKVPRYLSNSVRAWSRPLGGAVEQVHEHRLLGVELVGEGGGGGHAALERGGVLAHRVEYGQPFAEQPRSIGALRRTREASWDPLDSNVVSVFSLLPSAV